MTSPINDACPPTTFERFVARPLTQVAKIALAVLRSLGALIALPFRAISRLFVNDKPFFKEMWELKKEIKLKQLDIQSTQRTINREHRDALCSLTIAFTNNKRRLESFSSLRFAFSPVEKAQDDAFIGDLKFDANEDLKILDAKLSRLENYVAYLVDRKISFSDDSFTPKHNLQDLSGVERIKELEFNPREDLKLEIESFENFLKEKNSLIASRIGSSPQRQEMIDSCKDELAELAKSVESLKKTLQDYRTLHESFVIPRFNPWISSVKCLNDHLWKEASWFAEKPYVEGEHPVITHRREKHYPSTVPTTASSVGGELP